MELPFHFAIDMLTFISIGGKIRLSKARRRKMKRIIAAVCAAVGVIGALTIFFAMQATPKNVLNLVRAESLEAENGVITVPEGYTVIEDEAFAGKTDFNKVIIKGEVQIGERAFYSCTNLRSVVLEKKCDIGSEAFADCTSLESLSSNSKEGSCAENAFAGHGAITVFCHRDSDILRVAQLNDISYKIIGE